MTTRIYNWLLTVIIFAGLWWILPDFIIYFMYIFKWALFVLTVLFWLVVSGLIAAYVMSKWNERYEDE